MTQDPNDILMGGGGAPIAKLDAPGVTVTGRIIAKPTAHQVREYDKDKPGGGPPKFYPNSGDPIMGITVTIQTDHRDHNDDDGARRIYIESRRMKEAVRDAVQKAGATGLEVGGLLTITFTHHEDATDRRSAKIYLAGYTPAATVALSAAPAPVPPVPPPGRTLPPAAAADPWRTQTAANNPAAYTQQPAAAADPWQTQTAANNPAAYTQQPAAQPAPAAAPAEGVDQGALQAAMANLPPEVLAAIIQQQQQTTG